MPWWLWILLGFVLFGGEILTPGTFFFLFFGVGAVVVGFLVWLDVAGPPALQWFLFSVISLASLLPLRSRLVRWVSGGDEGSHEVDTLSGEVALLLDDIAAGETGKAELRGTAWSARNGDDKPLHKGQRAKVTRVEGLTLWLRAE